jgi:glycine cleavage system H protein
MQFTDDHEWIDLNGTVGFVGVSAFKLTGLKKIDKIIWHTRKGTIESGTLIAEIRAGEYSIPVHAPVSCKFLGPNPKLDDNLNLIIESPQDKGWVFFVTPLKFSNRGPLLSRDDYQKRIRYKQ